MLATSEFVIQNTTLHHYECVEGNFADFDSMSSINKKWTYNIPLIENIEERAAIKYGAL